MKQLHNKNIVGYKRVTEKQKRIAINDIKVSVMNKGLHKKSKKIKGTNYIGRRNLKKLGRH